MAEPGVKFATRLGFILAAMGSAVGLGNIWRFTFMAGENGGGAFIFFYFLFIIFLGIPCVIAMITIGRRGGKSPVGSTRALAIAEGHSENWRFLGWTAISIAFLALTFFSVIAGWVLAYLPKSLSGVFAGITAEESIQLFDDIQNSASGMTFWHGVFMAMTMWIVSRGVQNGLEKTVNVMMPALFIILLILVFYAALAGDIGAALRFMLIPDFNRVNNDVVLLALGQAFFSLSVGGGGVMNYGSYLKKQASIPRAAFAIAGANVSVDMLAGLAIFPIVFAFALEPAAGPGLIFVTLPVALGQMPGGPIIGTLFLLLVLFAALSTSISMLESVVSRLVEQPGTSRKRVTLIAGSIAWLIGLGSVFSHNIWSNFTPLNFIPMFEGSTIFRIIDFFVVNNLILVSAFFITIFVGWIMSKEATMDELGTGNSLSYRMWLFIMRFFAPVAIFLVALVTILSY
ncbi:MAG: sodium-dependent transporter [Gammaproteobacteria bacterium]|nr:sodium-dependent transporter [Gammaproteobacteria bacterium]